MPDCECDDDIVLDPLVVDVNVKLRDNESLRDLVADTETVLDPLTEKETDALSETDRLLVELQEPLLVLDSDGECVTEKLHEIVRLGDQVEEAETDRLDERVALALGDVLHEVLCEGEDENEWLALVETDLLVEPLVVIDEVAENVRETLMLRDALQDPVAVPDDVELTLSVIVNVVDFESVFECDIDIDAVFDREPLGDTDVEKDPLLLAVSETEPLTLIVRERLGDIEHVTEVVQLELEVIVDVGTSVLV